MTDRELDALVAEKVMGAVDGPALGLSGYPTWKFPDGSIVNKNHWHPSEDIAAAWQVVEKMRQRKKYADLQSAPGEGPKAHYANFEDNTAGAFAATMPRAICLAALTRPEPEEARMTQPPCLYCKKGPFVSVAEFARHICQPERQEKL